ncbi:MAG: hypothetical protein V8K32_07170 [Candidatus Electrothrix gigas]
MFNFKELKINKREDSSTDPFVGIRRNSKNEIEFRLPKGFENFPENDFASTKKLFFRMYRTFKKFEREHFHNVPSNSKATQKDNIESGGNGYSFSDKEGNNVVFYSKISVIENLLEAYDTLSLDVIERQVGRTEQIDYSKIDRYLDRAIYLNEDIIHIEYMDLPRNIIQYKAGNLIYLFCFILYELKQELEQEVDSHVYELASQFKEQFLSYDQSLFNEEQYEETIIILKDVLNHIDKSTSYKDNDYWQLYEAIESFLYGELDMNNTHQDGVFWGISNFYQIWEDMCNAYIFMDNDYDVVYADTDIEIQGKGVSNKSFGGKKIFIKENFENPFFIQFRDKKRWLRPDLVYFNEDYISPEFIQINILNINKKIVDFNIKLLVDSKKNKKKYHNICFNLKKNNPGFRPVTTRNKITFTRYPIGVFISFKKSISKHSIIYTLCDWKYLEKSFFEKESDKLDRDITKQLCYESCIQQYKSNIEIKNKFIIPFFYDSVGSSEEASIGVRIQRKDLYHRVNNSGIEVFKANFFTIQKAYLNNDQ